MDVLADPGRDGGRTEIRVHAYALMDNHYHLVIETPKANLVDGMKWFQTPYTRRFNVKNGLWGHLFGRRYKAIVVQHQEEDYYRQLVDYVHLNCPRSTHAMRSATCSSACGLRSPLSG